MGNGPYDVFGPHLGLGMPIPWFDAAKIEALLTSSLTSTSTIDQLVIGWDGETADAWDAIRAALRARGYFPGYSATGLLIFARARLANVLDIGGTVVAPLPKTLRLVPSAGDGVDRVRATYGQTPWFDGDTIEVSTLSDADGLEPPNSLRAGIFADDSVLDLDMSAIAPPDLERETASLLSYVAMRGLRRLMLYVRANDPGTIDIGDIVKVGDPLLRAAWFVDIDGNAIEIDASAKWYGQVVGMRRDLGDGSIDLEMQLNVGDFARVRAPSAIVASVASAVYTCEENEFGGPLGGGTDVEQFQVGAKVELWTRDFTRRSGSEATPDVQEITAIGTNTLTLDAAFTTPPEAGDTIRVAFLSTASGFPEGGDALVPGYLAYVFAAEDDRTLGPNDLDAHIYGYGVL